MTENDRKIFDKLTTNAIFFNKLKIRKKKERKSLFVLMQLVLWVSTQCFNAYEIKSSTYSLESSLDNEFLWIIF